MRFVKVILLLSLFTISTYAQDTCVKSSRIIIGDMGRITPGSANNVRAEPTTTAESVGRIAGGEDFTVLAGPVCDEQFVWVQIQSGELIGWTVEATADEYWTQPLIGELYEDEFVSLMIPEELAEGIALNVEDEIEAMGGTRPIRIIGDIEAEVIGFRSPRLIVAPVAEFEGRFAERAQDTIEDLTMLLDTTSEFESLLLETVDPNVPVADIAFPANPFLVGARRVIIVSPHYVDMTNGRGIAFVTMYAQDLLPVTNEGVFYSFVGLTTDGNYLVTFQYPVTAEILIGAENAPNLVTDWGKNYIEYIRQATESLNTLGADDWQPSLAELDQIVGSIYVAGGFE